jgi:GH43 family beta-xylosidase
VNVFSKTYTNPVHRGDAPDPSVIRVGERDFWATTTSTEWAPQFPLLHSTDLVHWEQAGAVFPTPPKWARGKFWAPEISSHDGRFFVYYVAQHRDGPLTIGVATSDRPEGPYEDHEPLVGQTAGSIDPTPVIGDDGRRYLIWKEDGNSRGLPTTIWVQALSEDGLSLVGESRAILRNDAPWEGRVVEAPSVIRRGEYFYLFYSGNSCCGLNCKYAVGVARARSIMGPWEKFGGNPILKGNADWRCPGHGSVVETADGRTFYLYHAYAKHDSIFVGRQTLLDEIRWEPSGWPSINGGRGPSSIARLPFSRKSDMLRAMRPAESAGAWQWPQTQRAHVELEGGWRKRSIVLGPAQDGSDDVLACVLARSPHYGDYVADTELDLRTLLPGSEAGICAYGDRRNAVGVTYRDGIVRVWQRTRGKHVVLSETPCENQRAIGLRIRARRGYNFSFEMRTRRGWIPLRDAPLRAAYLPPWDRGIRIALTAGGTQDAVAHFKHLKVRRSVERLARKSMVPYFKKPIPALMFR